MVDTTFPVIDKVRRVQAMDGFAHQDYVKLLGNGGPYKQSCVLPPLSILNTGFITTPLPAFRSTFL